MLFWIHVISEFSPQSASNEIVKNVCSIVKVGIKGYQKGLIFGIFELGPLLDIQQGQISDGYLISGQL